MELDTDRRQQIIEAAMRVFARDGYHKATIKSIAREGGLRSPALIYHYFDDKRDLFGAVIGHFQPFHDTPLVDPERAGEWLELPPELFLPRLLERLLALRDNPDSVRMMRLYFSEASRSPDVAEAIGDFQTGALAFLERHGRRRPYLLPLQVFVIANIVYFLLQPIGGVDTFTTPLQIHMTAVPYQRIATDVVERTLAARGLDLDEFATRFDATTRGQARTLVIVMVPLLVPFLVLAFPRRRPPMVKHLVFSTHIFAFIMLLLVVSGLGVRTLFEIGLRAPPRVQAVLQRVLSDDVMSLSLAAVILLYLAPAFRTTYRTGWPGAVARGLFVVAGLALVISLYRFILFFTTLYAA